LLLHLVSVSPCPLWFLLPTNCLKRSTPALTFQAAVKSPRNECRCRCCAKVAASLACRRQQIVSPALNASIPPARVPSQNNRPNIKCIRTTSLANNNVRTAQRRCSTVDRVRHRRVSCQQHFNSFSSSTDSSRACCLRIHSASNKSGSNIDPPPPHTPPSTTLPANCSVSVCFAHMVWRIITCFCTKDAGGFGRHRCLALQSGCARLIDYDTHVSNPVIAVHTVELTA